MKTDEFDKLYDAGVRQNRKAQQPFLELPKPFKWKNLHGKTLKMYIASDDCNGDRHYVFGVDVETDVAYMICEGGIDE